MIAILSVLPLGKGESLGGFVAEAVREVETSGLDYRLTAMGTLIEGDWDAVMRVVSRIRGKLLRKTRRLYMTLAIDDRKARGARLDSKVRSVEMALGKSLKKH